MRAATEGLEIKAMMEDAGQECRVKILTDSSAAKGVAHRHGTGRVKHLTVRQLWIQEKVERKEVEVVKIPRCDNLAGVMAHYWTAKEAEAMFTRMNMQFTAIEEYKW